MILKTLVFVLFDLLNKRYNMMPDSFLKWKVKTLKKRDIKTNRIFSLIGFHKVWFSWHLNEPCTWGNKPVCLAAPGAGSRNTCRCECVCMYGEHWGDCCFHASRPDALFAHYSFSFASTMLLFACLCVPAYNTALRGASCLSITGNGAHWSGLTETERPIGAMV